MDRGLQTLRPTALRPTAMRPKAATGLAGVVRLGLIGRFLPGTAHTLWTVNTSDVCMPSWVLGEKQYGYRG